MLHDRMPAPSAHDQTTDRSGAVLVKIANRLADRELAKRALDTLFSMDRPLCKTASFPADSVENVLLSRIYFEGQREKIAADEADAIDRRLSVQETLRGMSGVVAFRDPPVVKTASAVVELSPGIKIASKKELVQAGADFGAHFARLSPEDRKTFAVNFIKAASDMGAEVPEAVRVFAAEGVEARDDIADQALFRKVALERRGMDGSAYAVLCRELEDFDAAAASVEDLEKLARAIELADDAHGIDPKRDGLPHAFASVFRVKTAAEAESAGTEDMNAMTRADIVGRYGLGILEEVETPDGGIDRTRLKSLIRTLGGPKVPEAPAHPGGAA